ncbi:MAG: hypothetical protein RLZZ517_168 [Candidatus Parcubacteria bacterium]|jgi:uncharacterized protein YggE
MDKQYKDIGFKVGVVVFGLLALFLISKTVGEVISWSKDEIYPTKTITITSEGEALAIADIASFSFTVDEEGATSDEAQKKSTDKINKAIEYLKSNAVEEKDIKTENYSIYPKYESVNPCFVGDCPPPSEPKIIGYNVSQTIRVKVRDTQNTGKFLSELTKYQINNISGISFTIDDTDALYDLARKDAVEKAQVKATALAKDLNVKLGDVISFSEDNSQYYPNDAYGMGGAEMGVSMKTAVAPTIPKGENKYTTRVYVTYELK